MARKMSVKVEELLEARLRRIAALADVLDQACGVGDPSAESTRELALMIEELAEEALAALDSEDGRKLQAL